MERGFSKSIKLWLIVYLNFPLCAFAIIQIIISLKAKLICTYDKFNEVLEKIIVVSLIELRKPPFLPLTQREVLWVLWSHDWLSDRYQLFFTDGSLVFLISKLQMEELIEQFMCQTLILTYCSIASLKQFFVQKTKLLVSKSDALCVVSKLNLKVQGR